MNKDADVVVIGAGLAGLVAASALHRSGVKAVVVDKGRSVGGRLATRRIDGARLDHGAQFFTVRSPEFQAFVDPLVDDGLVYEWCRGFNTTDGYPRYATTGGMNMLAKHLAAGLDIRVQTELSSVSRAGHGWQLATADEQLEATAVIATPPVPQTLALLDAGDVALDPALRAGLGELRYHCVLALLVTLDDAPAIPSPGARQVNNGTWTFVADNQAKGISDTYAATFHANHDLSAERWDDDPDAVLADLLDDAAPWIGSAGVVTAQLKTWRYAGPVTPWPEAACVAVEGSNPLILAGDAFAGPKVEGAYLSGAAAAAEMTRHLS